MTELFKFSELSDKAKLHAVIEYISENKGEIEDLPYCDISDKHMRVEGRFYNERGEEQLRADNNYKEIP